MADTETTEETYIDQAPYEDSSKSHYVSPSDKSRVTSITDGEGNTRHLIDVEVFMAKQVQADDARRVLALINAWAVTPGRKDSDLRKMLDNHGLFIEDGQAMNSIIAQFGKGF